MAKIETYFDCDLKKAVQVQPLNGNVFSLDNNGNRIGVRIFDNGVKTTVTGTVTGRAILADNSTVNLNGGLTTVNGQSVAYVDVPQGALLIPGTIKITIQLTASGVITTLAAILSTVYQTKTDNVITPSAQVIADWNATISSAIQTQDAAIAAETAARIAADSDLKSALEFNYTGEKTLAITEEGTYPFVLQKDHTYYIKSTVTSGMSGNMYVRAERSGSNLQNLGNIANFTNGATVTVNYDGAYVRYETYAAGTGSVEFTDIKSNSEIYDMAKYSKDSVKIIENSINIIENCLDQEIIEPTGSGRIVLHTNTTGASFEVDTPSSPWHYIIKSGLTAGQKVVVTAEGISSNTDYFTVGFYKDNGNANYAYVTKYTGDLDNYVFIVPDGADTIVVNNQDLESELFLYVSETTEMQIEGIDYKIIPPYRIKFIDDYRISSVGNTRDHFIPERHIGSQCAIITGIKKGDVFKLNNFYSSSGSYLQYSFYKYNSTTGKYDLGAYGRGTQGQYTEVAAAEDNLILILNNDPSKIANPESIYYGQPVDPQELAGVKPIRIRVATYNTGDFTGYGYTDGSDEGALLMRKAIGAAESDVFGFQYDVAWYNESEQITPEQAIFSEFAYYEKAGGSNYNYTSIGGYVKLNNFTTVNYQGPFSYPARHTYFMVADANIFGVVVKVVSFHLDWSDKTVRRQQIAEIISYLSDFEYSIALGDVNPSDYAEGVEVNPDGYTTAINMLSEELPIWENAGYKPANDGRFGVFRTFVPLTSDESKKYPCDNIFISSNMYYKNVGIVKEDYMIDHCILWADIAIK